MGKGDTRRENTKACRITEVTGKRGRETESLIILTKVPLVNRKRIQKEN